MLNRVDLSKKNGWLDNENRVFIHFTLEDAVSILGCGRSKVIKILAELDTVKGIGLIERKKQGQGKPAIIYVKNLTSLNAEKTTQNKKTYPKPNFQTFKKQKSETDVGQISDKSDVNSSEDSDNKVENSSAREDFRDITTNNEDISFADVSKNDDLTYKNQISRSVKNRSIEFLKTASNKTKINNTKSSYNKSINQSSDMKEKDGWIDRVSNEEIKEFVLRDLSTQKTLPYEYTADERKMSEAIHTLTEYDVHKQNAEQSKSDKFEFAVFKLFNEALIQMLTDKKLMTLKGFKVTYAKVYEKLMQYLSFETTYGNIYTLQEMVSYDFAKACKVQEIKNHLAYMKSCIWNAMQVGDIGMQALILKDFG